MQAGDRLKEARNINRSLSQLGNLINILAEVFETGKQRHISLQRFKIDILVARITWRKCKTCYDLCGFSSLRVVEVRRLVHCDLLNVSKLSISRHLLMNKC
ncbi:uncharacterized protein [Rutidosis leptorrhynchoides]|uniref:uncharacterized protein isoform X2 n=1 Tax=Rutidosis leptorrhynchoides TaxID=125765 RepID=UPI003A997AF7